MQLPVALTLLILREAAAALGAVAGPPPPPPFTPTLKFNDARDSGYVAVVFRQF